MKNISKNSNIIDMTDFLTNNNTTEFELNFLANALDFNLWNLNVSIFFNNIIHILSPPTFCTIFNLITAFDFISQMQFIEKEKKSKEE